MGKFKTMKIRTLINLILVIALIAGNSLPSAAQTVKRIQFAKGKSSAVVRGTTGNHGVRYVLRARSGQKLVLDLSPVKTLGVRVETSGRFGQMVLLREESGGHYEIGLEESGDVEIFVGSTTGRTAAFTLELRVVRMADI